VTRRETAARLGESKRPTGDVMLEPDQMFNELVAQHAALRRLMSRCEELADELDAGGGDPLPLVGEVARLRVAFAEHDRFEEEVLRPLLVNATASACIEHAFADHVREHAEMRTRLCTERTAMLRDVIASLRAHLDDEEHYLLSAGALVARPVQMPRIMPPSTSRH
jgi:phosphoenolpyruvate-protein kinase (PTS system EI component)